MNLFIPIPGKLPRSTMHLPITTKRNHHRGVMFLVHPFHIRCMQRWKSAAEKTHPPNKSTQHGEITYVNDCQLEITTHRLLADLNHFHRLFPVEKKKQLEKGDELRK